MVAVARYTFMGYTHMTAAIYDFPAIAKLTKAFAEEPPQNEVKPIEPGIPGSGDLGHVYGYDADAQPFPADYSCWAAASRAEVFRWAYKAVCDDYLTANAPAKP